MISDDGIPNFIHYVFLYALLSDDINRLLAHDVTLTQPLEEAICCVLVGHGRHSYI